VNEEIRPLHIGVFGAGSRGAQCLSALKGDPRFVVDCVFDNDPNKWGSALEGVPIAQPTTEACERLDAIVLASVYAGEILAQLARLGCAARIALSPADLVARVSSGAGSSTTETAATDPEAAARLCEALSAQAPRHVVALADRVDRDPAPSPARSAAWTDETACTICCNNYFAYALVLARSFLRHHPGGRFFIGLADRRTSNVPYPDDPRIKIIESRDLQIPGFDAFVFKYDVLEFNTAIKPFLLEYLFQHESVRQLLYLDPDILVLEPLTGLFERLSRVPLVLTPHLTRPYTDDRHPQEIDIMRSGTFNLGFIGLSAHDQTRDFLTWWQRRLYDGCTREVEKGYFTDQKWIDFVPSFFPEHEVIREPGYNVAYWNLHERQVTFEGGHFLANGQPLRFFHFSGVDVNDLDSVSKHQNRHALPASGGLRDLFELYRLLLLRQGHLTLRAIPYEYAKFDNGVRIPDIVRKIYRESRLTGVHPHPAKVDGPSSYFEWLRQPSRQGFFISNLFATLHARMPEVRAAYPDLYGASMVGFLLYMHSASELYGLPQELAGADMTGLPTQVARVERVRAQVAPVGATVRAVSGSSDDASRVMSQGLASAVREASSTSVGSQCQVVIDHIRAMQDDRGPADDSATVGYWCWDERWGRQTMPGGRSEGNPPRVLRGLREIWVPSTYALEGLSRTAPVTVVKVPPPIGLIQPSSATRSTYGVAQDRFTFVSVVEPSSVGDAVDAVQAVRAFRLASEDSAFAARGMLLLRIAPSVETPDLRRALHEAAGGCAGVRFVDGQLAASDLVQLVRLADCYLSLRAVQAFDLWLAYALWHGKPAIAAAYGGVLDCATVNNSFLVDVATRGATSDVEAIEADLGHAGALMRHAVSSPDEVARRGARARGDMPATYALEVVAETIHRRLELLGVAQAAALAL
jgi:hypothetical protein